MCCWYLVSLLQNTDFIYIKTAFSGCRVGFFLAFLSRETFFYFVCWISPSAERKSSSCCLWDRRRTFTPTSAPSVKVSEPSEVIPSLRTARLSGGLLRLPALTIHCRKYQQSSLRSPDQFQFCSRSQYDSCIPLLLHRPYLSNLWAHAER